MNEWLISQRVPGTNTFDIPAFSLGYNKIIEVMLFIQQVSLQVTVSVVSMRERRVQSRTTVSRECNITTKNFESRALTPMWLNLIFDHEHEWLRRKTMILRHEYFSYIERLLCIGLRLFSSNILYVNNI